MDAVTSRYTFELISGTVQFCSSQRGNSNTYIGQFIAQNVAQSDNTYLFADIVNERLSNFQQESSGTKRNVHS